MLLHNNRVIKQLELNEDHKLYLLNSYHEQINESIQCLFVSKFEYSPLLHDY